MIGGRYMMRFDDDDVVVAISNLVLSNGENDVKSACAKKAMSL